jgi:hypothetical protein
VGNLQRVPPASSRFEVDNRGTIAAKGTGCDLLARLPSCDADLADKVPDLTGRAV